MQLHTEEVCVVPKYYLDNGGRTDNFDYNVGPSHAYHYADADSPSMHV